MIPLRAALVIAATVTLSACSLPPALPTGYSSRPPSTSAAGSPTATSDLSLGLTRYAPADRKPMPAISGTTLTGTPLDLATSRGKVVVLNTWASWCEPCRDELPLLVNLAKATPGVTFLGLNVSDRAASAEAMVREFAIPYPSIVDDKARFLARIPGVPPQAVPSTVVIDKQGRVAARIIGTVKPGVLDSVLAELQAEK